MVISGDSEGIRHIIRHIRHFPSGSRSKYESYPKQESAWQRQEYVLESEELGVSCDAAALWTWHFGQ